jgi:hypothetical protein
VSPVPAVPGNIFAYDAKTGKQLWSWQGYDVIDAAPITYSVKGKQYLAEVVKAPDSTGKPDRLTVFATPGGAPTQSPGAHPTPSPTPSGGLKVNFPTGTASNGASVFRQASCGSCHALAAAGANGGIGPSFDQLRPAIVDIETQVYLGGGQMPSFAQSLSLQQIADVAAYVYQSTH